MRPFSFIIAAAAAFGLGFAAAEEPQKAESQYVVVHENAQIPFGRMISSWQVGEDNSLLLRVGVNRWYRATVSRACARDLRWEQRLALIERGGGPIDRFGHVRLRDGRSCYFYSLDQIENPYRVVAEG